MYPSLKHYVYISDLKVNMYYEQIPPSILAGIAGELTLDIKPGGVGIGTAVKWEQTQQTRYSKLNVVVAYLERHMPEAIGWIDAPRFYFKGTLPMFWTYLPTWDDKKVVYFGGSTGQTIVGLGGSGHHMMSKTGDAEIGESSSDLPSLLAILDKELQLQLQLPYDLPDENAALDAVEAMARQAKGPSQNLEFLAIKLAYDPSSAHGRIRPRPKHVLLGTPIYVALTE